MDEMGDQAVVIPSEDGEGAEVVPSNNVEGTEDYPLPPSPEEIRIRLPRNEQGEVAKQPIGVAYDLIRQDAQEYRKSLERGINEIMGEPELDKTTGEPTGKRKGGLKKALSEKISRYEDRVAQMEDSGEYAGSPLTDAQAKLKRLQKRWVELDTIAEDYETKLEKMDPDNPVLDEIPLADITGLLQRRGDYFYYGSGQPPATAEWRTIFEKDKEGTGVAYLKHLSGKYGLIPLKVVQGERGMRIYMPKSLEGLFKKLPPAPELPKPNLQPSKQQQNIEKWGDYTLPDVYFTDPHITLDDPGTTLSRAEYDGAIPPRAIRPSGLRVRLRSPSGKPYMAEWVGNQWRGWDTEGWGYNPPKMKLIPDPENRKEGYSIKLEEGRHATWLNGGWQIATTQIKPPRKPEFDPAFGIGLAPGSYYAY